jgi:hypothetical protein
MPVKSAEPYVNMSNSTRKVARNRMKEAAKAIVRSVKKRKRDYIVRINVDTLMSVAVIRVPATSRKEAVELVKGAIELTGEVAPLDIPEVVDEEEKA